MNITIVCGHYLPELGYLEVHLARALLREGCTVSVVTSAVAPTYVRGRITDKPVAGTHTIDGITVHRLRPFLSKGQLVCARGVRQTTARTNPDAVLVIGLGKIFPQSLLGAGFHVGILLGDNAHTYAHKGLAQRLIQQWLKRPVYRKGIRTAHRIFTYTPETASVVGKWLGPSIHSTLVEKETPISLGFDAAVFHYDPELRQSAREEMGLDDQTPLVISVARLGPNKDFTPLLRALSERKARDAAIQCLLIGVVLDADSQRLRDQVAHFGLADVVRFKPFLPHREINRYYNAADIGYWPITAISVFEGMGTGLFLLVPGDPSLEHLALKGDKGLYFRGDFKERFEQALEGYSKIPRAQRAAAAVEKFAYDSIARTIVESMKRG